MTDPVIHINPGTAGVLFLLPAGVLGNPERLHRARRVDHRCAPSTSAARSTEGRYAAPAWTSAKASRINARACENLSNMCSTVQYAADNRKAYPQ